MRFFVLLLFFFFQPLIAYADIAVPVFAIVNIHSFGFALIFIILIEYFYLFRLFQQISKKTIFKWSLYINLVTSMVGAILLPALVAAMGIIAVGLPELYASILNALSTWSTGLSNLNLWIVSLIIFFWEEYSHAVMCIRHRA